MRILLLTEFYPSSRKQVFTGGVEVRTFFLAQQLRHKHQVQIISRDPKSVSATLSSLPSRASFLIRAISQGLRANPQIIEGSNWVTHIPAFVIAKLKRVPAVAWYPDVFIGTWTDKFGLLGIIGEITERIVVRLPWSHIIALSRETKLKLIRAGVNSTKITVVHAGVDTSEINQIKAIKYTSPTICCISRLVSYKRVQDLLRALQLVQQQIPAARLIVIGTGPEEAKLHQLATTLSLDKSVTWKKNLSRQSLLRTLKSSHVFCLPSTTEGFGLVTLEALAAGVPYVNANIAINTEVTRSGSGGLLFTPENPRDLASKLTKLLTNKKLRASKMSESRKLLAHYSWDKAANETLKVYQSMLR